MNCPKCGSPKAKYVESRKRLWGGNGKHAGFAKIEPRTNFQAKCLECGFEWNDGPVFPIVVVQPQAQVNAPSTENKENQA